MEQMISNSKHNEGPVIGGCLRAAGGITGIRVRGARDERIVV